MISSEEQYEKIILDSIRYLRMNDFSEIDRMTLYEYEMRMKAFELRRVDREYEIHLQAWSNWNVQATKRSGKKKRVPVFKFFRQFFDYEKAEAAVLKKRGKRNNPQSSRIIQGMEEQKKRRRANG